MPENPCASTATCDAITRLVPGTVLVRFIPHTGPHPRTMAVHFYDADFRGVLVDRLVQISVARSVMALFPGADWRRGHDLHVPARTLYRSPLPTQSGFVPDDDRSFGLSSARRVTTLDGETR